MQDSKELMNDKNKINGKIYRWLEILGFILLLVVVLQLLSYFMNPIYFDSPGMVSERDKYVSYALQEPADSIDVLILGDSEAMVLASTEILWDEEGISSYICAQHAQRLSETYFFLKDISKKQHPKVVIIETNAIVHDTTNKLEALMYSSVVMNKTFPILRYHNEWRQMWGLEPPTEYIHNRGFEKREVIAPYSGSEYMIPTKEVAKIDVVAKTYLEKIRKMCDEKGISLVLVSSPSSVNMNYAKHNVLQKYADENNIDFIDFNLLLDEIQFDWETDTGDSGDHINYNGTVKTTHYLMNYLKNNYDLPDRRND